MATFTPTSSQSVSMTSAGTPVALNLTGSPTVCYLTVVPTGVLQGVAGAQNPAQIPLVPNALHQAFVALGGPTVQCHGPQDGAQVGQLPQRFVLSGATYISAVNDNGDGLVVSLGTEA